MHLVLLLTSVGQLLLAAPARADTIARDSALSRDTASLLAQLGPVAESAVGVEVAADTVPHRRHHAIVHSDAYYTRLTIHRIGSYTMLPLFGAEYVLGQQILNGSAPPGNWKRGAHAGVAGALGVLFTVNTITGGWNLWDDRHTDDGRALRYLHTGFMLASDAGFAITGALGGPAKHDLNKAAIHRNFAIGSIGLATAGTLIMWFRRD